jgi:hypothetical protein
LAEVDAKLDDASAVAREGGVTWDATAALIAMIRRASQKRHHFDSLLPPTTQRLVAVRRLSRKPKDHRSQSR